METKKELQKEIDNCIKSTLSTWAALQVFYENVKDIVARMPDGETKPEPSLLEVAMNLYLSSNVHTTVEAFDLAKKLIAENERRKNGK